MVLKLVSEKRELNFKLLAFIRNLHFISLSFRHKLSTNAPTESLGQLSENEITTVFRFLSVYCFVFTFLPFLLMKWREDIHVKKKTSLLSFLKAKLFRYFNQN